MSTRNWILCFKLLTILGSIVNIIGRGVYIWSLNEKENLNFDEYEPPFLKHEIVCDVECPEKIVFLFEEVGQLIDENQIVS